MVSSKALHWVGPDNPFHRLRAHAALDRAVWAPYGWQQAEVLAEVEQDVILSQLRALKGERAGRA